MQDPRTPNQRLDDEPDEDHRYFAGPDDGLDAADDGIDSFDDDLEPPAIEEPPRSLWRTLRSWVIAISIIAVLAAGVRVAGDRYYNPTSRVPDVASYSGERGLFGANTPILAELDDIYELAGDLGAVELMLSGDVFELGLPRTFGDRLFDKRNEHATVFYARSTGGRELRFLVLRDPDASSTIFAIDTSSRPPTDDVLGTYLALPGEGDAAREPVAALVTALTALLPDIDAARSKQLTADDYTIFGPFDAARVGVLKQRVAGNYVMAFQASTLEAKAADVTMVAPLFVISSAPERGTIRGIFASRWRTISEPLWGTSETSVLAHELTHAYIDRVLPDANNRMREAAAYFEDAHPRLYGEVVDELYAQLNDAGRAEETLAFLMGSIAEGDTETVAPTRILGNQAAASTSESVLKTDIELLIDLGLLPACMRPSDVGHTEAEITFDYYDDARDACS